MKKTKNLIILTTATNRGDLHKHVFLRYKRFLTDSSVRLKILWVINIDRIPEFTTENSFVRRRIEKIFCNRPEIEFKWISREDGNFYRAVRTLFRHALKKLHRDCEKCDGKGMVDNKPCSEGEIVNNISNWNILYLEDDWCYREKQFHIGHFLDIMDYVREGSTRQELDYLELRECPTPAFRYTYFSPSLWSVRHFHRVTTEFFKEKDRHRDPEQLCKPVLWGIRRGSFIPGVFSDIGRDWLESQGISKNNNKKKRGAKQNMYLQVSK